MPKVLLTTLTFGAGVPNRACLAAANRAPRRIRPIWPGRKSTTAAAVSAPDPERSKEVSMPALAADKLDTVEAFYRDDPAIHRVIYNSFTALMQNDPDLIRHRLHVERERLGFGDRAFHWLWKLIVDAMPARFRFLEIGVFMGQVISLIGLLAKREGKDALVYGVSPLDATGDKYSDYQQVDYAKTIETLQEWCVIPATRQARLIKGLSTDDEVKRICRNLGPFDAVYIDGGHDYHIVVNDIVTYGELVGPGGYLAMDDAATVLRLPPGIWPGHADVGRAVQEVLQKDGRFKEVVAVGHVRVWRKAAPAPTLPCHDR
jgi:hypothetical protein